MELKTISCKKCGRKYLEHIDDYDSVYYTGYCGDCFLSRIEEGKNGDDTEV